MFGPCLIHEVESCVWFWFPLQSCAAWLSAAARNIAHSRLAERERGGRESTQTRLKEGDLGFEEDFVHNTDSCIKSNAVLSLCVIERSCKILCSRVQLRRCKDGKLLQVQSLQNFWSRQLQVDAGHSLEKIYFFWWCAPCLPASLDCSCCRCKVCKNLDCAAGSCTAARSTTWAALSCKKTLFIMYKAGSQGLSYT